MHRIISTFDLFSFDESTNILLEVSEQGTVTDELLSLLFTLGMDIKEEIFYECVLHYPLSMNTPVEGGRFVGKERSDKEWMESEYCTIENRLERVGIKDRGLQKEMMNLYNYPNYTGMIVNHLESYWGSPSSEGNIVEKRSDEE